MEEFAFEQIGEENAENEDENEWKDKYIENTWQW